ncbi:GntR family transcriptional regulator [Sphingomonas faeni]|uniref:GntR family transcriptional regulator n=1 Tax=Sphingomonas faeni TaxID=185950 RepID=UPI00335B08D0
MDILSKADIAYAHIASELRAGTRPPGGTIVVKDVAKTLKMTETPVREALERLKGQGAVIAADGRRGFAVSNLLSSDLVDYLGLVDFMMASALAGNCRLKILYSMEEDAGTIEDAVGAIEGLIEPIVNAAQSLLIAETMARTNLVLAPYRRAEMQVLNGWRSDIRLLRQGFNDGDPSTAFKEYTARRTRHSSEIVEMLNRSHRPITNRFQI